MRAILAALLALILLLPLAGGIAQAQLRGHGGPVRAVAVAPDGETAISGSFDSSAIRWSLKRNAALQVMRFHEGAVNAVALPNNGRMATAGEDGRIALWRASDERPERVLEGHKAPVVALAVSPDGAAIASASWDHTAALWLLAVTELSASELRSRMLPVLSPQLAMSPPTR